MRHRIIYALLIALVFSASGRVSGAELPALVSTILNTACLAPYWDAQRYRHISNDVRVIAHDIDAFRGKPGRSNTELLIAKTERVEISLLFPGGQIRRVTIETGSVRPTLSVQADGNCQIKETRRLAYDGDGRPNEILVYGPDLGRLRMSIPLNPPVPSGTDPGGISVGLIDSGINYTIEPFLNRLARDGTGRLLGRDFWDGDDMPYDADTARSPFFPLHHGSAVASVLIREAPNARILPVRYPRPDMTKLADAVDWLAEQGVRVVNLAMGSNNREEWRSFEDAAERHPQILFVISAGNNGRDIDRAPVYPAALGLANSIVVTSSELDGRIAEGSNWGSENVDIMAPGERVEVVDHRGAPGRASGSSFAVPRITALVLRLLAKNPAWHGPELRDAILKRARPMAGESLTRYGWIPDPLDGP